MNTENTIYELQQLKLKGMLQTYQKIISMPQQEQPGIHHFMAQLSEAEIQSRLHNRTEMYLKLSKLRYDAVLEQVHCTSDRNLSRESVSVISDCGFVKRAENNLITGATGCGKSFLACALAHQACLQGYKTSYLNMNRLIEKITLAKLDGSYLKMLNQMEKLQLIILDDFGLQALTLDVKLTLLQLLEDRYERKSMIITSQLPVSKWYEYFNDPTLADAIMDRMSANSIRIELKGSSRRTKN